MLFYLDYFNVLTPTHESMTFLTFSPRVLIHIPLRGQRVKLLTNYTQITDN